ncbi:MAG: nitroreductase family protein [Bacteroidota bacterium]|nr:nitroreductase family protein [Bacteroidota bacterium]
MVVKNNEQGVSSLHELLRQRWSPHHFSSRAVGREKLTALFQAAQSAPSSYNEQPWAFIVATKENPEDFGRILAALMPRNQEWAQHAPVLIVSVAKINLDRDGKANRHALYDLGAASAHLTFQATALGLYVHQMGGFSHEKIVEEFSIPEGYEPVAVLAVGYLDEEKSPAQMIRKRKALKDFVFESHWGISSPSLALEDKKGFSIN